MLGPTAPDAQDRARGQCLGCRIHRVEVQVRAGQVAADGALGRHQHMGAGLGRLVDGGRELARVGGHIVTGRHLQRGARG